MADNIRRRWGQFSLRTILWLLLMLSVVLTAYRQGFNVGFSDGVVHGANQRTWVGTVYAKAYNVADLIEQEPPKVPSRAEADDLIRNVTKIVLPHTWQSNGGQAAIAFYESNLMIVASHDRDGHERIAGYLEQLRHKARSPLVSMK
jgi:hypothetical protein